VFLSVRPPRPAHEEAHLRATREGDEKEKEKKQEETLEQEEEEEIGGGRDGQSSYQPPASFTPFVNQPRGRSNRSAGPLVGGCDRRGKRGVARLLFFSLNLHTRKSEHPTHPSLNASYPVNPGCSHAALGAWTLPNQHVLILLNAACFFFLCSQCV